VAGRRYLERPRAGGKAPQTRHVAPRQQPSRPIQSLAQAASFPG
jgi:hypothetical protein